MGLGWGFLFIFSRGGYENREEAGREGLRGFERVVDVWDERGMVNREGCDE